LGRWAIDWACTWWTGIRNDDKYINTGKKKADEGLRLVGCRWLMCIQHLGMAERNMGAETLSKILVVETIAVYLCDCITTACV
jgi:hypothetical protein